MKRIYWILGPLMLAIVLTGAAPWKSLPPYLLGKWEGITVTDPNGNIVGTVDPTDWVCPSTGSAVRPQGVPVPPPSGVCLRPAYPNPANTLTVLNFSIPSPSQVSLVVYGKKGNGPHGAVAVRTLESQQLMGGQYSVHWDGKDDQGVPLPPDIYRAVLVVGDKSVWGDIQIQ